MKGAGPTPKLTKEGAALRKFALSFPDAHEDFPWGHVAVKIGKKAFVFISAEGGVTSMSAKLPQSKISNWHLGASAIQLAVGPCGRVRSV